MTSQTIHPTGSNKRSAAKQERLDRIRHSPNITSLRAFARTAEPRAIKIYAGSLGRGTHPNLELERDDGSRVAYWGRMRKDGSFRRRTDVDRYNDKNLVFVGCVNAE